MDFVRARMDMVEHQLVRRGIRDPRVLAAFRRVPREAFVPSSLAAHAYEDRALAIAEGQSISQPYIVALTLEELALGGTERVLEVGAGSGYAAALLGELAAEVFAIERLPSLAIRARARLARLGYDHVHVVEGDGTVGLPEHAPFDAIAVAAGGPRLPEALLAQLAPGGRLVMPVGPAESQLLTRFVREPSGEVREEILTEVRFVPLIGAGGWPEPREPKPCDPEPRLG